MASRIKVTRTLVYEGSDEWITRTLKQSYIKVREPFVCVNGTIRENDRIVEDVGEVKDGA